MVNAEMEEGAFDFLAEQSNPLCTADVVRVFD